MLENDGLIEPTPQGAVPADGIEASTEEINGGLDELIERLSGLGNVD